MPFSSPGDLPDPGIEPGSPALQVDSLPSEPPGKPYTYRGIQINRRGLGWEERGREERAVGNILGEVSKDTHL